MRGPARAPRRPGVAATARPRAGARRGAFTLVEVLVAIAIYAIVATAVAGLWATALRTTVAAEAATARARALEPYTVPAALAAQPPPPCPAATGGGAGGSPCLAASVRCDVAAGRVQCAGSGALGRFDLRLPAAAHAAAAPDATATVVRVWARWRP